MDDRYFSDKKRQNPADAKGKDKYLKADYYDENFSLKFRKGQGNAQSFQKSVPKDEELFSSFVTGHDIDDVDELFSQQDKAVKPQTNRVYADRTVRTPSNTRTDNRAPRLGVYNTLPGDPSRTPTGKRVVKAGQSKNRKKKKSGALKAVIAVLIVLIIAVGSGVFYLYNCLDDMIGKVNYDDSIIQDRYLSVDAPESEGIKNILLIGSDARKGVDGQRSDTMILFTVDSEHGQIKLTSFLRDSYVYIPCLERKGKMNAAYSKDGAQGVIDTIEYNYGINVHNYVSVDFETFEMIIDILGGVTVDGVTEKEARYMNSEARTDIKAGSNHMNGYEALWYCRIRKLDSDFYRTQRQRKVLEAVINKAKQTKITELVEMIEQALPYITTDMPKKEIIDLGKSAVSCIGYDILQQQIPADGTWRDGNVGGSYVIDFDIEKNKELLVDFVYQKAEKKEE